MKGKSLICIFRWLLESVRRILKWEDVDFWANRFSEIGIKNILLSDTTGVATAETISVLFEKLPAKYPEIDFGAHFHNRYEDLILN